MGGNMETKSLATQDFQSVFMHPHGRKASCSIKTPARSSLNNVLHTFCTQKKAGNPGGIRLSADSLHTVLQILPCFTRKNPCFGHGIPTKKSPGSQVNQGFRGLVGLVGLEPMTSTMSKPPFGSCQRQQPSGVLVNKHKHLWTL